MTAHDSRPSRRVVRADEVHAVPEHVVGQPLGQAEVDGPAAVGHVPWMHEGRVQPGQLLLSEEVRRLAPRPPGRDALVDDGIGVVGHGRHQPSFEILVPGHRQLARGPVEHELGVRRVRRPRRLAVRSQAREVAVRGEVLDVRLGHLHEADPAQPAGRHPPEQQLIVVLRYAHLLEAPLAGPCDVVEPLPRLAAIGGSGKSSDDRWSTRRAHPTP